MIDFDKFILENKDTIFRINTYKKVYTPYELDKKYSDESEYENGGYYLYVKLIQAIEIPNDVFLKFQIIYSSDSENIDYIFRRLSDIKLYEFSSDNEEGGLEDESRRIFKES